MPAIFLNTIPKSGSVFIAKALQKGLKQKQMAISNGYWMNDVIDEYELYRVADNGWISQTHTPASPRNLALYDRYTDRIIVHVRDPRQSTLSWCHHLNDVTRTNKYLLVKADIGVPFPDWFLADGMYDFDTGTPHPKQLDWLIEHNIAACVEWITQWLEADARRACECRILFTTYEELNRDSQAFFGRILDFMEIPASSFTPPKPPRPGRDHYRVGKIDEWRLVYTPEQQEKATALIPSELFDRFAWLA